MRHSATHAPPVPTAHPFALSHSQKLVEPTIHPLTAAQRSASVSTSAVG